MQNTVVKTYTGNVSAESAKKIIENRAVVTGPGNYVVKVKNVATTKDGNPIINTNCCTLKQIEVYKENTNCKVPDFQYELNRCQLSYSRKELNFIPQKDEYVTITVAEIITNHGQSKDWRIVDMKPVTVFQPLSFKELAEKGEIKYTPAEMLAADIAENRGTDTDMPF